MGEAHPCHHIVLSGPGRVFSWFFSSSDAHHLFIPVSALTLICLEIGWLCPSHVYREVSLIRSARSQTSLCSTAKRLLKTIYYVHLLSNGSTRERWLDRICISLPWLDKGAGKHYHLEWKLFPKYIILRKKHLATVSARGERLRGKNVGNRIEREMGKERKRSHLNYQAEH